MPQLIVTADEAIADVPGFAGLDSGPQADLAAAATSTINAYCGRVLTLTTHDEIHRPANTRTIRLKQYPVADVYRLCTGLASVLTIQATGTGGTKPGRATVKLTATGQGDTLAVTGVALSSTVSGVVTTTPLLFSGNLTLGGLGEAINGVSGWTATVPPAFVDYATADLNPDLGAKGAIVGGASYWAFTRDLSVYDLTSSTGAIAVHEDIYPGFSFPTRTYAASGQWDAMRCIYAAGFNNDPDMGPITMPDSLKRAAFVLIQLVIQRTAIGLVQSESISQRSVTYKMTSLMSEVDDLVAPFRRRRIS